jgi:hypothetical protein
MGPSQEFLWEVLELQFWSSEPINDDSLFEGGKRCSKQLFHQLIPTILILYVSSLTNARSPPALPSTRTSSKASLRLQAFCDPAAASSIISLDLVRMLGIRIRSLPKPLTIKSSLGLLTVLEYCEIQLSCQDESPVRLHIAVYNDEWWLSQSHVFYLSRNALQKLGVLDRVQSPSGVPDCSPGSPLDHATTRIQQQISMNTSLRSTIATDNRLTNDGADLTELEKRCSRPPPLDNVLSVPSWTSPSIGSAVFDSRTSVSSASEKASVAESLNPGQEALKRLVLRGASRIADRTFAAEASHKTLGMEL